MRQATVSALWNTNSTRSKERFLKAGWFPGTAVAGTAGLGAGWNAGDQVGLGPGTRVERNSQGSGRLRSRPAAMRSRALARVAKSGVCAKRVQAADLGHSRRSIVPLAQSTNGSAAG